MVRLLLAAVLLRILSTAGHQNERLVPSNFDITSVAEKLAQLLASVQTSGMDDNSCAYDVAGNDTEAALKSTDSNTNTEEQKPRLDLAVTLPLGTRISILKHRFNIMTMKGKGNCQINF